MRIKILWPGKTRQREWHSLEEFYIRRIRQLEPCQVVETKEARGLKEKEVEKIKEIEARGLEKHLGDDYIICLSEGGKHFTSDGFARLLSRLADESRPVTFVVGGFAGLAPRILARANLVLSLSRMTLTHELTRVVLLEQIYRALTMRRGTRYAK